MQRHSASSNLLGYIGRHGQMNFCRAEGLLPSTTMSRTERKGEKRRGEIRERGKVKRTRAGRRLIRNGGERIKVTTFLASESQRDGRIWERNHRIRAHSAAANSPTSFGTSSNYSKERSKKQMRKKPRSRREAKEERNAMERRDGTRRDATLALGPATRLVARINRSFAPDIDAFYASDSDCAPYHQFFQPPRTTRPIALRVRIGPRESSARFGETTLIFRREPIDRYRNPDRRYTKTRQLTAYPLRSTISSSRINTPIYRSRDITGSI